MLPLRCRDARLTFRGPRAGAQAPVQSTPGLAIEWGLLARGAAAGSGAAGLEGALGAQKRLGDYLQITIRHPKISA